MCCFHAGMVSSTQGVGSQFSAVERLMAVREVGLSPPVLAGKTQTEPVSQNLSLVLGAIDPSDLAKDQEAAPAAAGSLFRSVVPNRALVFAFTNAAQPALN